MRFMRSRLAGSARWLLLAFLVSLIPATSHAGVFISVGFAPPPLLVYEQPICPEPGLMWTPGYWAYGPDGYYWVPGAWVPAPYEGALWTPGYWGWGAGLYVWHPGYWGPHVGYYGGVNYGFGYMGIGFVGGEWRGGVFAYNTAVMHVGSGGVWGSRVYVDRTIVERNTIVNDRHVAFSGGPGGINHPPTAQERAYSSERHMAPTAAQTQHMQAAMHDHNAYYNVNHGHPAQAAVSRPLAPANHAAPAARNNYQQNRGVENRGAENQARPMQQRQQQARPEQQRQQARPEQRQESRPASRPEEHAQPRGDSHDRR